MRVLAVNQFYLPDLSATAQLLGELCEDLRAAGHQVQVIASRGTYLGGPRLPRTETPFPIAYPTAARPQEGPGDLA
jgi:hypothetical protein